MLWVSNGAAKIRLLINQVRSITHKVDLLAITQEDPLVSTDGQE